MSHTLSRSLDMEPLKSIPGYQAILKAVLKSQIQFLVEQLCEQTGEESVLLTASLSDGTLTHLGSSCGEYFLQDHEEFKSQFLGFCLQRQFKRKSEDEPMKLVNDRQVSNKRHKSLDDVFTSPSSIVKEQSDLLRAPITSTCFNKRKLTFPSEQFSDDTLNHSDVLEENEEKPFAPGNNCKIPEDFGLDTDIEKGDFVGSDDKSHVLINAGIEGGASKPYIIIKQEPDSVSDSTTQATDTYTDSERSSFSFSSIQQSYGCGKNSRRPQPHVRLSKTSVVSPTTEQFGDSTNTGVNLNRSQESCQCQICGRVLAKKCHLSRHMRIHTGEKPFECKHCGRRFAHKHNMKAHEYMAHMNLKNINF